MNIQNLPRHDSENPDAPVIHRIFKPKLDALMFFDWKSMELTVLAYYLEKALGDSALREKLLSGIDLHMDAGRDAVGDVEFFHGIGVRDVGKKLNYSLVYGGGAPTISEQLGIPLSAARVAVQAYHKANPGLRNLQNALEKSYAKKDYIRTLYGRELKCDPEKLYKLPNILIQGSCAEIMKRSCVKIHRELGRDVRRAHLVAPIHDEFIVDVRKRDVKRVARVVPELMRDARIEKFIPLETDCEITYTTWVDKVEYSPAGDPAGVA